MNELIRRPGDSLDRASGRAPTTRLQRAVEQEVALVQGRGIIQGTRAHAVGYVADLALSHVERLTELEGLALQRNPLGDARYKMIVDTATMSLARIVTETGQA